MKSFIIHLPHIASSLESAIKTQADLESFGISAELFEGTDGISAQDIFEQQGRTVHPTNFRGDNSDEKTVAKSMRPGVMGCFYSHYRLWQRCAELNETIGIFEDDLKIIRPLVPVKFNDVLIVALGAKKRNKNEHYLTNPTGEYRACVYDNRSMPGTVGYIITPIAANKLLHCYKNTFLSSDNAINKGVVAIQIHSHVIGDANLDKQSLTSSKKFWKNLEEQQQTI